MTGMDNLRYLASINCKIGDDEIRYALKRVGLNPDDRRIYQKYSLLEWKQRIAIPLSSYGKTGCNNVR